MLCIRRGRMGLRGWRGRKGEKGRWECWDMVVGRRRFGSMGDGVVRREKLEKIEDVVPFCTNVVEHVHDTGSQGLLDHMVQISTAHGAPWAWLRPECEVNLGVVVDERVEGIDMLEERVQQEGLRAARLLPRYRELKEDDEGKEAKRLVSLLIDEVSYRVHDPGLLSILSESPHTLAHVIGLCGFGRIETPAAAKLINATIPMLFDGLVEEDRESHVLRDPTSSTPIPSLVDGHVLPFLMISHAISNYHPSSPLPSTHQHHHHTPFPPNSLPHVLELQLLSPPRDGIGRIPLDGKRKRGEERFMKRSRALAPFQASHHLKHLASSLEVCLTNSEPFASSLSPLTLLALLRPFARIALQHQPLAQAVANWTRQNVVPNIRQEIPNTPKHKFFTATAANIAATLHILGYTIPVKAWA